jgi:nitrate reductase delta subunit
VRRSHARLAFGVGAVLLSYPDKGYPEDLEAVASALGQLPGGLVKEGLSTTRGALAGMGLFDAQARYVETFDLSRRRSLHLTYYRHGDTRERGLALAALAAAYRQAGVVLAPGELPDFLPALLELAAVSPVGQTVLCEHRGALAALQEALSEAGSPWTGAVGAVRAATGGLSRGDGAFLRHYRADGPPTERVGLEPFAPPEVLGQGITTR